MQGLSHPVLNECSLTEIVSSYISVVTRHVHSVVIRISLNPFTLYNHPIIQLILKSWWTEVNFASPMASTGPGTMAAQEMFVEWIDSLT